MVAWEGYLSLHKFAGFPAFHLKQNRTNKWLTMIKSGHESLSDTNIAGFVQT